MRGGASASGDCMTAGCIRKRRLGLYPPKGSGFRHKEDKGVTSHAPFPSEEAAKTALPKRVRAMPVAVDCHCSAQNGAPVLKNLPVAASILEGVEVVNLI